MKMKIYIILFLLVALNSIYAQVGIGTTSPNGALDVTSTTDGMLIPRVALAATNVATVTTPTISELVYNTFTSAVGPNQVTPGFYYWDGSLWNKLAVGNTNTDWTTTGNAGTTPAANFFGTTDNQDIVIKRNNSRAGYIGDPTYDGSFNFINGNTSFGANSMLNPTVNFASQNGVRNTAFGVNVMPGLTTGRINTGVGEFALFSNTTGIGNTSIGSGSLFSNSSGASNVAIGRNALTTSNADNNTAVGFAALRQNASGTNNTALGFEALRGILGSGNVGVGYQAGRLETGSNRLYIENSNADANNALIYGEFDNDLVRINGKLQLFDPITPSVGNKLEVIGKTKTTNFQMTNGAAANYILQSDATGNASWSLPNSTLSVVRANLSADQVVNATGWQKITFDTVVFDVIGGEFVTGTNRFVATKAGYYEINAGFHTFNKNDSEQYAIAVYKNGVEYQETAAHHYGDKLISRIINCTINLAVNDYVEIYIFNGNAPTTVDGFSGKTYFEIKQIR